MTGRTFSQAIEFIRISLAARLLTRVAETTNPLARRIGFAADLAFCAPFRAAQRWLDKANPFVAPDTLRQIQNAQAAADAAYVSHEAARDGRWSATDPTEADYADEEPVPTRNAALARLQGGAEAIALRVRGAAAGLTRSASAAAARSRAACRSGARSVRAFLIQKISNPGETAAQVASAARAGFVAMRGRILRLNRIDATVAGLFALALLGPLAAPKLSDRATVALTRHNPLVDRVGVTAERGLSLSKPDTPTLWTGFQQASAERDIAPDWVLNAGVDYGPLSPADALTREARVIELNPAPLWSPALAALSVEDDLKDYEKLETASIQNAEPVEPMEEREIAALELGAFDTGPTAPVAVAEAKPVSAGDAGLAAGDYATASVSSPAPDSAWPTAGIGGDAGDLPSSLAEALNLDGPGAQSVPPSFARVPSMRPVMTGVKRTPRMTVVLTAVGLNEAASRAAMARLPSSIAMAIAPVANDPAAWVDAAHASGRTALLEIPMEPVTYPRVNPGPLTLLADKPAAENIARLDEALAKAPEVDGVASYLGGRFSSVRGAVQPVMAELKKRNLFMLETDPGPLSHLLRTAAEIDAPAASSFVSLDKSGRASDLSEGFARLEEAAKVKGHAIGVAVAVPQSVAALEAWARDLEKRGFRLTALSM